MATPRETKTHDINFKDAVPHFEEMLGIVKQLSERDISRLTTKQLGQMEQAEDRSVLVGRQGPDGDGWWCRGARLDVGILRTRKRCESLIQDARSDRANVVVDLKHSR